MTNPSDFRITPTQDGTFSVHEITVSLRNPIFIGSEQECREYIDRLLSVRNSASRNSQSVKRVTKSDIRNRIREAGPEWSLGEQETLGLYAEVTGRQFSLLWKGRHVASLGFAPTGKRPPWTEIYAAIVRELRSAA